MAVPRGKCRTVLKSSGFRCVLDYARESTPIRQHWWCGGVRSFSQGPTNSVTGSSAGIDARPLRPTRSCSSAFSAGLNGDLEDRFLQKSSAGQWRVRVMGKEDREVTGWDRKPAGGDILVKLDVPLLVKYPDATVTC